MTRCRLAVLASHPIQYFTPIYRRLARHPDIDLEVMFYRDFGIREHHDAQFARAIAWDTDQLSGYKSRFLTNVSPVTNTFNPLHAINPGAFTRLLRRFDAVWLNGYMYPSNWLAAAAAHLSGTAILFRSELQQDPSRQARWTDSLRERVIRGWVRRSDALLFIGENNRQAYLQHGADAAKLFFTPYSADIASIAEARERADTLPEIARARFGVPPGKRVILFVGKMTPRKHPEAILEIAVDPRLRDRIHVIFAGSGPMERALHDRTRADGMRNVSFLGFVNQSALPDVYAIADIFVMPSEQEPWGIVLNEAMAGGAIPVVSDAVGAGVDLVIQGESGARFPSMDWEAMRGVVEVLLNDDDLRNRLSYGARRRVANYGHDQAAEGIIRALESLGLLTTADLAKAPAFMASGR